MPILIQPYREEHEPAVQDFNRRLQAAGDPSLVFYKTAVPHWLPKTEGSALYNEYFVALDSGVVRGAYALKHEQVFVQGKGDIRVACYHHPLSEGILNRAYASVGGLMVRDALSRQPLLYALGMGGTDRPLAKMLKSLGWSLALLPFHFRIVHPKRFLNEMQALRTTTLRKAAMDAAAASGVGWLAVRAAQGLLSLGRRTEGVRVDRIDEFSEWANWLWIEAREHYYLTSLRDSKTLRRLYSKSDNLLTRLRVRNGTTEIGWAVVGERREDPKFGAMRVGSIVDCWASPENARDVLRAATEELEKQGFDMIVANHSHTAWSRALRQCGFFNGPSNFVFAASKKYAELLPPLGENVGRFHITRADGDGLPRNF
jgi:hypothetical protein